MPRYTANVALSIKGDRVEKGGEFDLTKEEAAAFDPNDITEGSVVKEVEPEVDLTITPLEDMTHGQLKDRAKELGLVASGSKADLQERIKLHLEGTQTEGDQPEGENQGEKTEGDQPEGEITND